MKRVVLIAAIAVLSGVGFLTAEFAVAADAPAGLLVQLTTLSVESL